MTIAEPAPGDLRQDAVETAQQIASLVLHSGATVAVAESLTSGAVAAHLGAAHRSSEWFCGGVIAYLPRVKFDVLGVTPGPVITADCGRQMAYGVQRLMDSVFSVAVTGAGGPGPEEGKPAGTAFIATATPSGVRVEGHHFDGTPTQVVYDTVHAALLQLHQEVRRHIAALR